MNATLMKNDKQMTVNVDRIRPYDRGIMSIEDQHKRDIELAEAELSAINDTITELHRKKRQLMIEQQVSSAGVTIEQSQSQHVMMSVSTLRMKTLMTMIIKRIADMINNHSVTFSSSSWEATSLTSMDLVVGYGTLHIL